MVNQADMDLLVGEMRGYDTPGGAPKHAVGHNCVLQNYVPYALKVLPLIPLKDLPIIQQGTVPTKGRNKDTSKYTWDDAAYQIARGSHEHRNGNTAIQLLAVIFYQRLLQCGNNWEELLRQLRAPPQARPQAAPRALPQAAPQVRPAYRIPAQQRRAPQPARQPFVDKIAQLEIKKRKHAHMYNKCVRAIQRVRDEAVEQGIAL